MKCRPRAVPRLRPGGLRCGCCNRQRGCYPCSNGGSAAAVAVAGLDGRLRAGYGLREGHGLGSTRRRGLASGKRKKARAASRAPRRPYGGNGHTGARVSDPARFHVVPVRQVDAWAKEQGVEVNGRSRAPRTSARRRLTPDGEPPSPLDRGRQGVRLRGGHWVEERAGVRGRAKGPRGRLSNVETFCGKSGE